MAVSAPTFVLPLANDRTNVAKIVVVDITLDSSYATGGGEAFDIKQLGLSEVWFASIEQKAPVDHAYLYVWDYTNKKIVAFNSAGDGDVFDEAGADDLSTYTVRAFFYGLSS